VGDLLPINRTGYFSKKSINPENDGHENKQIQRRADQQLNCKFRVVVSLECCKQRLLVAALSSASNVALLAERFEAHNGRIARIILLSTVLAFFTFSGAVALLIYLSKCGYRRGCVFYGAQQI
jgi:hypothetical protein